MDRPTQLFVKTHTDKTICFDDAFGVMLCIILSAFVLSPAPRAEVLREAKVSQLVFDAASGCFDVCRLMPFLIIRFRVCILLI